MIHSIVTINGSSRPDQHNAKLLCAIAKRYKQLEIRPYHDLSLLPLYIADQEQMRSNQHVKDFKQLILNSDAIIISTPEYIHSLPAVLKNALEWLTESGELHSKKVLALTYTPHQPRGTKCMNALVNSLSALNANIIATLQLYQNELKVDDEFNMQGEESVLFLDEAINQLTQTDL